MGKKDICYLAINISRNASAALMSNGVLYRRHQKNESLPYIILITKAKTSTQFSLRDYMDYYGEKYFRYLRYVFVKAPTLLPNTKTYETEPDRITTKAL